jgi:hypothetical protein
MRVGMDCAGLCPNECATCHNVRAPCTSITMLNNVWDPQKKVSFRLKGRHWSARGPQSMCSVTPSCLVYWRRLNDRVKKKISPFEFSITQVPLQLEMSRSRSAPASCTRSVIQHLGRAYLVAKSVFYLASQDLARTHALLAHGSAAANSVHEVNSALEIFFTQACVVLLRRRCRARASGPTHRGLILGSPTAEL